MRIWIAVLTITFFVSSSAVAKLNPQLERELRKLIRLTTQNTSELVIFHKAFKNLIDQTKELSPAQKKQIIASVERKISRPNLEKIFIPVYAKYYSLSDVRALLSFYRSSIGRKLLKIDPKIKGELQQAGMIYGKKVMGDIAKEIQDKKRRPTAK